MFLSLRDGTQSVNLMQAALLARVHVTNLYKMRSKLGAFKHQGVWHIPLASLEAYIQKREARARQILTPTAF